MPTTELQEDIHSHLSPRFPVITMTYNAEKVLENTIQSMISQIYHHMEYITIGGVSEDGTMAIVNRYRDRISRMVSEPDKGLYDAMNKGIALVTGDYPCSLNAGDSFHEGDTLQKIVHSVNANELPDVLYGQIVLVDTERHFLRMCRLSAPEILSWRSFKQGMFVYHQAFLVCHTLVEPHGLRYHFSADFDWRICIMKKARILHNTYLTLVDYLEEGMATQSRKKSFLERFRIMTRYYGLLSTPAYHAWFVIRSLFIRSATPSNVPF